MLTFERGVEDFTLACGTGCGSIACTLQARGLLPGGTLTAHNRGGTLGVKLDPQGRHIRLEGPTEVMKVFDVKI